MNGFMNDIQIIPYFFSTCSLIIHKEVLNPLLFHLYPFTGWCILNQQTAAFIYFCHDLLGKFHNMPEIKTLLFKMPHIYNNVVTFFARCPITILEKFFKTTNISSNLCRWILIRSKNYFEGSNFLEKKFKLDSVKHPYA